MEKSITTYISNKDIDRQSTILETKLFVPSLHKNSVTRLHLMDKLELYPGHKLTIVSAPAGYGKTTLISKWLGETDIVFSWLSLDRRDNEILRFLKYLIVALQKINNNIGQLIQGVLGTSQVASYDLIIDILINDIMHITEDFILVFDDYHVIHNEQIYKAIQYLINHQPQNMHIVIISREEISLYLSRMRVAGQLIEIDYKDLSFREDEIESFFRKTISIELEKPELELIGARTEGWVAALRLMGLSLQGMERQHVRGFIQKFGGSSSNLVDYLMEEVFERLNSDICLFLYHTSILNRYNADLCNAVLDREDSERIIELLDRLNLFLIPLDDNREWYRYHHLFVEFLQAGLGQIERKMLCLRTVKWMEEHCYLYEAIEYAIESKETNEIERLLKLVFSETHTRAEFSTYYEWLNFLADEKILSDKELSINKAWSYFLLGKPEEAYSYLVKIEDNNTVVKDNVWNGRLLALKSAILIMRGDVEALQMAQQSFRLVKDTDVLYNLFAMHSLGHSYALIGNMSEAIAVFKESFDIAKSCNYHTFYICTAFYLASCLIKQGFRRDVEELCMSVINEYKVINDKTFPVLVLHIPLGITFYYRDDLVNALKYLYDGTNICSQTNILHIMGEGEWHLAFLQYTLGDVKTALKTLRDAKQAAKGSNIIKAISLLNAAEAYIRMKEGDFEYAAKWAETEELTPTADIKPLFELKYIIYAHVLIAQNNLRDVSTLLSKLESSAIEGERYGSLISIYILQSKVSYLLNFELDAIKYLRKAINHAAQEEYYRQFLDEGDFVKKLLPSVRDTAPDFVDELLRKLDNQSCTINSIKELTKLNKEIYLSDREVEVLRLISYGLSNEEISKKLYIALGTTKSHVTNINSKLAVKNRTQAVAKARELEII